MRKLVPVLFVAAVAAWIALGTVASRAQLNQVGSVQVGTGTITVGSLASTSTDGQILTNPTAALVGAQVQMSPRLRLNGQAWNTGSVATEAQNWKIESLPAAGNPSTSTLVIGNQVAAGAYTTPLTIANSGVVTASSSLVSGSNVQAGASNYFLNNGRSAMGSSADKLTQFLNSAAATGIEVNEGSATLGTCTAGTITTGSHSTAGGYTGNTSGSCVVNFGTSFTNAPFCVAMSIASTTHPRVSATAVGSITITGGVSGEAITYLCLGRIGT